MKKFLFGLAAGLVLGLLGTWLVLARPRAKPSEVSASPSAGAATPEVARGEVRLSNEQIAAAGLTLAHPKSVTLEPTIVAYGRVLDPAPLVAAAAEVATARAALDASQKEFARVKSLHDEGNNASTQALEAAEAAAQRDRVQLAAARARFVAAWGPTLASRLDSGLVAQAIERGWPVARLDVPPGEATPQAAPKTALVAPLAGSGVPFEAEVLGPAPTADPQFQGLGYLVWLRDHPVPAGTALRATLPGEGPAAEYPTLPRSAFVRHEGSVFVFVQTQPNRFERRRVELGEALPDAVAITSGVGVNDSVVVSGAQQLLSTELAAGGSGD